MASHESKREKEKENKLKSVQIQESMSFLIVYSLWEKMKKNGAAAAQSVGLCLVCVLCVK